HQPITTLQIPIAPITPIHPDVSNPPVAPTPILKSFQIRAMALKYAPLIMSAPQGALPVDYQSKITLFDGTRIYTAQQHTKKMTDYFGLYE
ncbi:hypothetical protein, partial [Actinobacillus pleuropneumoniae]|uniref:hypothetical protein n=1 Tax=Actinobacillus pleuropneumoniae TaxID=715 RepID=UPI00227CE478